MRRRLLFVALSIVCVALALEAFSHVQYVRLVQMGLILVLLAGGVVTARGTRRDWLIGATSLWAGLILIEGVCATIETRPPTQSDEGLSAGRPILGWAPSHPGVFRFRKVAANGRVVFDVHVGIDDHLVRETKAPVGPHVVAFFGDSFTFGEGVDDADTLPQSFADLHKQTVPVLNLAFSGWSPAQNLASLQFDLYKPMIDTPRRFVLMTAAWHAERTSCKADFSTRAPRYAIVDGQPIYQGPCFSPVAKALKDVLFGFASYRVLLDPILHRPSSADIEAYIKIVDAFVKVARTRYGAQTTIVFLPYGDAYLKPTGWTEARIVDALRESGADVLVDHLPPIADPGFYRIEGDGHPTGLANRARAKEIADHLDALERASDGNESASIP